MLCKGNCLDGCVMDNLFGWLQDEKYLWNEYAFRKLDELKEACEGSGD